MGVHENELWKQFLLADYAMEWNENSPSETKALSMEEYIIELDHILLLWLFQEELISICFGSDDYIWNRY